MSYAYSGAAKDVDLLERGGGASTPSVVYEDRPTGTCCGECGKRFPRSLGSSLTNRYFLACVVYVIYALGIIWIDYVAWPDANNVYTDDDDNTSYPEAVKYVNNLYIGFAVIHLFNAFQFMGSWLPLGFGLCSVVQIPEILNVVGASLYLWSASLYDKQDIYSYQDDITMQVHRIETAAASIEIIAALGWVVTWWLTYPRGQLGRGWTLDDPDSWANVFIVVPSIFYVAYNAQILADTTQYGANTLYITGDILYCAGSFFYLFASMRDDGWWWCMPGAGACALGCDAVTPIDPSRFESEAAGYGRRKGRLQFLLWGGSPAAQESPAAAVSTASPSNLTSAAPSTAPV